ncbi:MAG: hypothetical protein HYR64_07650 [Fimbriimonas ginsengisoli]|uniref:Uncharacterized protein n=1 Tax=Fimbriimonas ginsengisoli TaxID=1005039 RepID=A0A931LVJ5_FIMGI|nr:hypothetical protein [Fimbriimonas ginsengisoli]
MMLRKFWELRRSAIVSSGVTLVVVALAWFSYIVWTSSRIIAHREEVRRLCVRYRDQVGHWPRYEWDLKKIGATDKELHDVWLSPIDYQGRMTALRYHCGCDSWVFATPE